MRKFWSCIPFLIASLLFISIIHLITQISHTVGSASALGTSLIFEDFEDGAADWNLDGDWTITQDGDNHYLQGLGDSWAVPKVGEYWTDYTVTLKIKRQAGTAHLNIRMNDDRGRYIIGFIDTGVYLRKETPWGMISEELNSCNVPIVSDTWYLVEVEVNLNQIKAKINETECLDYSDSGWTLWQGGIGFESSGGETSNILLDDITVIGLYNPENYWEKAGGPSGGMGYDVRFGSADRQDMFVTDNYAGVFKSNDGGNTWHSINNGITSRTGTSGDAISIFMVSVDPNNQEIIWTGMKDTKGLYKSFNGGMIWENVTPPISEDAFVFRGVTVQDGNSDIIYAGGNLVYPIGSQFNITQGRIYNSRDGGQTWNVIWEGDNLVRYTIVHPNNPDIIYASTGIFDREAYNSDCTEDIEADPNARGGVGILKGERIDENWNWTVFTQTHGLYDLYIGSLVMHPTNPDILLAGAGNLECSGTGPDGYFSGGIYLTSNGGLSWSHTLTREIISSVEFSPSDPNIAYAGGEIGFYISHDGGWNWDLVNGGDYPWGPPGIVAGLPIDILVDPVDPDTLFVNNYGGGNIKSTDGGNTFTLASQGYTGAQLFDVEAFPDNPSSIIVAGRSGVFQGFNKGASWRGLSYPPANFLETSAISIKPDESNVLIAGAGGDDWMYRSIDNGNSWEKVFTIPNGEGNCFRSFAFANSNPEIVYAGTCTSFHTTTALDFGLEGLGIYKSGDGGNNWQEANDANVGDKCAFDIAVHPQDPNTVYIATTEPGGVYKTNDGGEKWIQLTNLPTDARTVEVHPTNPDVVFVGSQNEGVFISMDGGSTWASMIAGMEPNDYITAIAVDPIHSDVVYASSLFTGVYRWEPDIKIWTHINSGLRMRAVKDLDISNDGRLLYAATWGEGLFWMKLSENLNFLPIIALDY